MRILTAVILVCVPLLVVTGQPVTQQPSRLPSMDTPQMIEGGAGMTFIDGQPYYLVHFMPELSFGKIGIGLDVNLRVGQDGKIRQEDFKDAYSYLRLIRYLRYGTKHDPWYARIGALDYARLGHGSILSMYRNSASYDLRKIGLEFDADFHNFGFESVYSDIAGAGVFGVRGFLRPLQLTDASAIPIVGGMEIGATLASDVNGNANRTWGDAAGTIAQAQGNGSLSIAGADLGFPLLSHELIRSTLYFDYAKILAYGSGSAVGLSVELRGLGLVTVDAKYERRFVGNQFLPSYFDASYELERYRIIDTNRFISKAQILKTTQAYQGYYGEMLMNVLGIFNIVGGYQSPVGIRNAGVLHLELQTSSALPGILLSGGYDKINVGSVFRLDNNSLLFAQIGYKPVPWMVVSTVYLWTFSEVRDASTGAVVGYTPQKRIEPRVDFVVTF